MRKVFRIIQKLAVILFFVILFIYAIDQARSFLYPIVMGVLFAYLLFPVGQWLEKHGLKRIPANFLIIFSAAILIGTVLYILYTQIGLLIGDLPELLKQADHNVDRISKSVSDYIGVKPESFQAWMNKHLRGYVNESGMVNSIFPSTTATLTALGLMPVYVFLILYYRDKLYNFFMMVWPERKHAHAKKVITEISYVTKRYMSGVFTVVLILCVINSFGLIIIGIHYPVLLGILSALCNFIPYFGTLIGAVFPLAMAIFTGSPQDVISVVIMFALVQFTENNILTPNITGGSVQINPMVTILAIIAGGILWGLPGMFVVVPIMGMLKIILESDPATKPLAFLLGTRGTEEHAITMRKIKRFFKIRKKSKKPKMNKSNSDA